MINVNRIVKELFFKAIRRHQIFEAAGDPMITAGALRISSEKSTKTLTKPI
jgi:hypothetical protein